MSRNNKSVQIYHQTLDSNSSGSVKYLIRLNYYIQIKETTGTCTIYLFTQQLQVI